jgi:hypothetical protein
MKPYLFRIFLERYIPRYNAALMKLGVAYTGNPEKTTHPVQMKLHEINSHVEPMLDQIQQLADSDEDVPDEVMGHATHDMVKAISIIDELRLARLN